MAVRLFYRLIENFRGLGSLTAEVMECLTKFAPTDQQAVGFDIAQGDRPHHAAGYWPGLGAVSEDAGMRPRPKPFVVEFKKGRRR